MASALGYVVIGDDAAHILVEQLSFECGSRSALENARMRTLFHYWESKLGNRPVPLKKQIDPVEIPKLLEYILMAEVQEAEKRYRFLNVGTHVVQAIGHEFSWKLFAEARLGAALKGFTDLYDFVRTSGEPVFFSGSLFWKNRDYLRFDEVLLPLSRTGERIDCFIGAMVFPEADNLQRRLGYPLAMSS